MLLIVDYNICGDNERVIMTDDGDYDLNILAIFHNQAAIKSGFSKRFNSYSNVWKKYQVWIEVKDVIKEKPLKELLIKSGFCHQGEVFETNDVSAVWKIVTTFGNKTWRSELDD
jgi:hypothetical protein